MQVFIYCKFSLHVSGVHRAHHQSGRVKTCLRCMILKLLAATRINFAVCWDMKPCSMLGSSVSEKLSASLFSVDPVG